MFCKRSKPTIGKLSEFFVSGNRVSFDTVVTSPRSPLDLKNVQSRIGFKNFESGGVGLGIVVALGEHGREIFSKHAICNSRNLQRSDPIPVHDQPIKNLDGFGGGCWEMDEGAAANLENYTHVTYRVPNQTLFPTSDFLSSCHLCEKKLHGKDIYMYRGEKGFCSNECRSTQMVMDDWKEKCRSESSRSEEMVNTRQQIFSPGILVI